MADECFSFDGQGFSPEALAAFKNRLGANFSARGRRIRSLSAANDYVNVLGDRLMPDTHIHYFESFPGYHPPEAILDLNGYFRPRSEQGKLSRYAEAVSEELMQMPPAVRQHITVGIMNIFQQHFEQEPPVDTDAVVSVVASAIDPLPRSTAI